MRWPRHDLQSLNPSRIMPKWKEVAGCSRCALPLGTCRDAEGKLGHCRDRLCHSIRLACSGI